MDKITYLAELAEGLARWVPERERQDILRWYAEYFEEAGPEREADVVAELGDPWALSCRLAVEGGYVTHEKAASWRPKKLWRRVLVGTAAGLFIFALVAGTGLLGALAFNGVRAVSGIHEFGEVEQVTVVDWGMAPVWGDYHVAFEQDPSGAMGYYEIAEPFSSIDANIPLGNIMVTGGEEFSLSFGWNEDLEGYMPAWEIDNGVLKLRDNTQWQYRANVNSWEDLKNRFGMDQPAMDVTITVPVGVSLDRISVRTGLGEVWLYGVKARNMIAETGMGDVECYKAWNVGMLELVTGTGDVYLGMDEALPGLNIRLKTGKGNVEADLCGLEEDYSYALESGMGAVTVNGNYWNSKAERRGALPYDLTAESGMGDVNMYFSVR